MAIGNSGSASSGAHLHATASKMLKGVFGATTDKVDLKKLILSNGGGAVAPKVDKKTAKAIIKGEAPKKAAAPKAEAPKVEAPKVEEAKTYTISTGDTLGSIANQHNTTVAELAKLNNIADVNVVNVGQVIKLP
jgi:LysM repeat protein